MTDKNARLRDARAELSARVRAAYPLEEKALVFGEGNTDAALFLLGEAPGEQETKLGRPFVGQAGKNLDAFLSVLCLPRDALYITNVVKFRPYKTSEKGRRSNRPPTKEEIVLCAAHLSDELAIVAPRVVVTLGNIALRAMLPEKGVSVGQAHGAPVARSVGPFLFPLYHPASVIYNRALAQVYANDLQKLTEYLARLDD